MIKECAKCGEPFKVKRSHYNRRFYCTKHCMAADYRTRMKGGANPNAGKFRRSAVKTCCQCGKEFYNYNKKLTCSQPCKRKLLSSIKTGKKLNIVRNRVALGRKCVCVDCGLEWRHPKKSNRCDGCKRARLNRSNINRAKTKPCPECGVLFGTFRNSRKKFCSKECYAKTIGPRQTGSKSHLWKGGTTSAAMIERNNVKYSHWRLSVFERDNFECLLCGKRGGRLSAHHIRTFSDWKKLRTEVSNGVSLCWSCHTPLRGKEKEFEQWLRKNKPEVTSRLDVAVIFSEEAITFVRAALKI